MFCAIAYARAVDLVMVNVSFSPKDSLSLCFINGPEKLFIAKSPIFFSTDFESTRAKVTSSSDILIRCCCS